MPVRANALAALALALLVAPPGLGRAADGPPEGPPATPDSVAVDPTASPTANVRAAYETAYGQRKAGDPLSAIGTAEAALLQIEVALSEDPDATTRLALVDLRSKLVGLRDAAESDLQAPDKRGDSGNEADDGVLNAPAAAAEIQPQYNAQVYKYIQFFCGAGRPVFEKWLKRSGRYMHLFRTVLQREGLPPDLVHLVFVESGFNLHARSNSAAVGPWQFLRSTGRLFGLTVNQWVDERRDPEKSTVAAARYLKHLYSIFGDWPLALASYNAGEGAVLRAIKTQGTTNYWDLKLPRQTEEYVPQFMACLAISRDPHRYGFDDVELDDPVAFDEVAFRGAVDLRAIATLADCSYEELRDLNPAVLRSAARGPDGITTLRVPQSKGQSLMRKLEEGGRLPAVNLTVKHRVRRGETLQQIANHYGVSARDLARVNGIGRRHPLRTGVTLTVPASLAGPSPAVLAANDPRASTDYVPERTLAVPAVLEGHSDAEGRVTVRVKRGETLKMIAQRNDCTVEDLMRWNHLSRPTVHRGQRLKVRTGDEAPETASRDSAEVAKLAHLRVPPTRHRHRGHAVSRPPHYAITVKDGDTLAAIARRTGVSVAELKRANGLSGTQLRSGQRLRVPRGSAG
ncbi:MAG TPA: LysM peptidoglycan-binding domain-containing protein [Candidatus Eisenbacteria bacterium]